MQNSRSQAKHDLSAALALEVKAWQKAGNAIKVLPSCAYAHQLYCVQGGSQQSEGGQMRVGTFVPPVRVGGSWVLLVGVRPVGNGLPSRVFPAGLPAGAPLVLGGVALRHGGVAWALGVPASDLPTVVDGFERTGADGAGRGCGVAMGGSVVAEAA
jgi:hypothetical protein